MLFFVPAKTIKNAHHAYRATLCQSVGLPVSRTLV